MINIDSTSRMEPLMPENGMKKLEDLAFDFIGKANRLTSQLKPQVIESIGDLVLSMNCYYSNLIEGHNTHPRDIERALEKDFSSNKEKRKNQKWKNKKLEDVEKTTPQSNQEGKSSSNSNKKGDNNKEKKKCSYCKKLGHEEHECYHKKIDDLMNIIKKHDVPLPNTYEGSSSLDSKGKGKALMENSNSSKEWILDLGASYHMGSSKGYFSLLK